VRQRPAAGTARRGGARSLGQRSADARRARPVVAAHGAGSRRHCEARPPPAPRARGGAAAARA
jgi:hypothetical protein